MHCWIPYSRTLSREKTFANWWFSRRKLSQLTRFCSAKGATPPNFTKKTCANSHKIAKLVKVFSLKSFPIIYGTSKTVTTYYSIYLKQVTGNSTRPWALLGEFRDAHLGQEWVNCLGNTARPWALLSLGMHICRKNEQTALEIPQGLEHCLVSFRDAHLAQEWANCLGNSTRPWECL